MMKKSLLIFSVLLVTLLMGITAACAVEPDPICGNDILELDEQCDDGGANQPIGTMDPVWDMIKGNGDRTYCSDDCEIYEVFGTWCGDLITQETYEECDGGPACFADCTLDDEGPDFADIHSDPLWPNCYEPSNIYATITDESGIPPMDPPSRPVTLHYKYDGWGWNTAYFTFDPVGDVYRIINPVNYPKDAHEFRYYIEAEDIFGNINFSGDEEVYEQFIYDCKTPTASVIGMPTSWVDQATATANCTDTASGCNPASYKLYVSATEPTSCPIDESAYTLPSPSQITAYSWVCSYVEDNVGNKDVSDPEEFLVDGVDPTADANGPYYCNEGETITLDASASTDDIEVSSYSWDLDGDGYYDDAFTETTLYYCADGDYSPTVSVKVTDHVKNTDTADSTVTISNVDPWDADAGGPYTGDEGTDVALSGSADDVPADTLSYAWDLDDDGTYETSGPNVDFACVDDLVDYPISMKVSDEDGGSSTADTTVTCENVDPWNADAGGPYTGNEGSDVALSGSADDVPADTLSYAWDLDDNPDYETLGKNVDFACVDDSINDISLKVTDEDGGEAFDSATVTCLNVNPVVDAGDDQTVNEGEEFTITPSFTDVGVEDTHTAIIIWGDGSADTIVNPATSPMLLTHTYCIGGDHTVTVRVTDDDGGVGEDTLIVTVNNVAPTITSTGGPYFGVIGDHLTFNAEAEDVCGNRELTYSWDFSPDGNYVSDWVAYWNARFNGMVVLTVSDGIDSVSVEVPVTIYDYKIELEPMCNLISIPLVPEDTDIEAVLNGVTPKYVWAYKVNSEGINEWSFYESPTVGDLTEMIPGYGYYICMEEGEEATIYQNGDKFYEIGITGIPMPPQVELTTGWNLIGHYGMNFVPKFMEQNDLSGGILTDLADITLLGEHTEPDWALIPKVGYWAFITGENNLLYAPSQADYKDWTCFKPD